MIIVVGGVKGGSGKTTIATNLTVLRSKDKKKVLLVNADEQKSTINWANQREMLGIPTNFTTIQLSGKGICSQIQKMRNDYDDIIVDVGGRDTTSQKSAISVADVYLIPCKPRSLDVWTIVDVSSIIAEMKLANPQLQAYSVINQADHSGTDNKNAIEVLKEREDIKCLDLTIGSRNSFANAASDGLGVIELKVIDPKASQEIKKLYKTFYR